MNDKGKVANYCLNFNYYHRLLFLHHKLVNDLCNRLLKKWNKKNDQL